MSPGPPRVVTDKVEVYVFRRRAGGVEFLQLRRAEAPLAGTWQPVIGHAEGAESGPAAARRELLEETGLDAEGAMCLGMWALPRVYPYYMASEDAVVLAPMFAAEAAAEFEPRLSAEHDAARWVWAAEVEASFVWPGQRAACGDVLREVCREGSATRESLRLTRR